MALYEFRCTAHECPVGRFTVRLNMGKSQDAICPECGKRAERVYSKFGGRFGDTPRFHGRTE